MPISLSSRTIASGSGHSASSKRQSPDTAMEKSDTITSNGRPRRLVTTRDLQKLPVLRAVTQLVTARTPYIVRHHRRVAGRVGKGRHDLRRGVGRRDPVVAPRAGRITTRYGSRKTSRGQSRDCSKESRTPRSIRKTDARLRVAVRKLEQQPFINHAVLILAHA